MKTLFEKLAAGIQYLLPHHFLSAVVYRVMRIEIPWIKNFQIRAIARIAGVNWAEAESSNPDDYIHFNQFFTRRLSAGARTADPDPASLLSPCDGHISELGKIARDQLFQAKSHHYSLRNLLADDPLCSAWENGHFCTIYLSPRDYHRVHMPLSGDLLRMTYVPGRQFSVAPYTVRQVPGLFARNERLVCIFETTVGPVAQILVGAMLVSSMATVWAGEITPGAGRKVTTVRYEPGTVHLERATEMGRFNMGSTVIMVLPPGAISGFEGLAAGDALLQGQKMANLRSAG